MTLVRGHSHDINIVQGTEVVKMENVVVDVLCAHGQVSQQGPPPGYLSPERYIQGPHAGHLMNAVTHTTKTARHKGGISWISSLKEGFEPPGHGPAAPRVFDLTVFHLDRDAEMSFNPSYRINCDFLSHLLPPPFVRFLSTGESSRPVFGP